MVNQINTHNDRGVGRELTGNHAARFAAAGSSAATGTHAVAVTART
jgi:hypothetical protein